MESGEARFIDYKYLMNDKNLQPLHKENRWKELVQLVLDKKAAYEKDLDMPLVTMLDSVYTLDQEYRGAIDGIEKKYGRESQQMKEHWGLINKTDEANLVKVKRLLDDRGWLGANVLGDQGNTTLFLVIQHADIKTQEAYVPMMREAVAKGNSLALLEDRIALGQGKR
ncbi:MAG: hypothetical protein ACI849_000014 [Patiriisocius sp.]|jgi:hypothetical protein